jgi:hypothetical protein
VKVYQGLGPTDAYLLRDWLQRNGITAEVRGESLMSLRGDVPLGQAWPALWVPPGEKTRTELLIAEFEGPVLVHPHWRCGACAEENGPNFASCWSCGAVRPDIAGTG